MLPRKRERGSKSVDGPKKRQKWSLDSDSIRTEALAGSARSGRRLRRLEYRWSAIEFRDFLGSLRFRTGPVIGGNRYIDRGQHEQREQGSDGHAGDNDQPDREPARRTRAGGRE